MAIIESLLEKAINRDFMKQKIYTEDMDSVVIGSDNNIVTFSLHMVYYPVNKKSWSIVVNNEFTMAIINRIRKRFEHNICDEIIVRLKLVSKDDTDIKAIAEEYNIIITEFEVQYRKSEDNVFVK